MSIPETAQVCDGPDAEDACITKPISDQDDVKQKTNGGSPNEPIYAVHLKRVSKQHSSKNSLKSAQSFN